MPTTDSLTNASQSAMNSGEYLRAYELALQGLEPSSEVAQAPAQVSQLKYLAVLALARMGATHQAKLAYAKYQLHLVAGVDAAALEARIEKDIAINAPQKSKATHFLAAATRYHDVFKAHGENNYYPAINAASMFYLAGDQAQATELAQRVLELISAASADYWSLASVAEANLLLGQTQTCINALQNAIEHPSANLANIASTRRQFKLLTDEPAILAPLLLPTIIHFAGHIISAPNKNGQFSASQEPFVTAQIEQLLNRLNVAIAYGSLAAGADIIIAEQVLARGGELHVVLPFDQAEFINISVAPSGQSWVRRFNNVMRQAASCTFSSQGPYNGNDALFNHCSVYAMGRACLRQQHLDAPVTQVLVWNGDKKSGPAGTYSDQQIWQSLGYSSHIVSTANTVPAKGGAKKILAQESKRELNGVTPAIFDPGLKAILFGDVAGFSKLNDAQLAVFVQGVLGRLAKALEQSIEAEPEALLSVNTWGDGIFVVLNDVNTAAKCAWAMQEAMHNLELSDQNGAPSTQTPQLRIGAHFGPIFEFEDPMTKRRNFFGQHVNTAARIEPIAPQGQVYVTEAFAAHLALDSRSQFKADYVGEMELAKKFGKARMYLLRK